MIAGIGPRGVIARARSAALACVAALGVATLAWAADPSRPGSVVRPPSTGVPARRPPAATPAKPRPPARTAEAIAADVRAFEERGAYGLAAGSLRELRAVVRPDADLELALALDEARTGQADSANARLWGPLLTAALADSAGTSRRHDYDYDRFGVWSNGRFDGWYWYVARARAELALAERRWDVALSAARQAAEARPLAGRELLLVAVAAGRAGDVAAAERAAREAASLEPSLPEARYLNGLYAWRNGRTLEAATEFRAAMALDSTYVAPAVALVRSRLPGAPPDSLPVAFLHGARAAGMLTSPERPKLEEFVQVDTPSGIARNGQPTLPDSLKKLFPKPIDLYMAVLVDERGHAILHELPWLRPEEYPADFVRLVCRSVPEWRFTPALRQGVAQRVWATLRYKFTL